MGKTNVMNPKRGLSFPFGVSYQKQSVNFSVMVSGIQECFLNLYSTGGVKQVSFPMYQDERIPGVFTLELEHLSLEAYEYTFETNKKEFVDPYARVVRGRDVFGKAHMEKLRAGFLLPVDEVLKHPRPNVPYHNMILYELHVRGFTMHETSKVTKPGTFAGIKEKIPYLKELGVNALLVMPLVEFNEVMEPQYHRTTNTGINYWGYQTKAYYFAPKSSYAYDTLHPDCELKQLIFALHENGIEFIMDMEFSKDICPSFILECLRYWYLEYRVDGFRLHVDSMEQRLYVKDPILKEVKILASDWEGFTKNESSEVAQTKNRCALMQDSFSYHVRRFLKGDEDQIHPVSIGMKRNPDHVAVINYITSHDGFTLHDLYTYDVKHNEANGENNRDGLERNYSWNCGVEGETKRANVLKLRAKMIRNAFLMLLLAQGTPMLLAGDEFGQTQYGNNNAYCQDNEISWLDWELYEKNKDLVCFVKRLIEFRKNHKILHMTEELRGMDYIYCKMPDISFHGVNVWQPDFSYYRRELAILLCGKYAFINRNQFDFTFYLVFNMYWEPNEFALPCLEEGELWYLVVGTDIDFNSCQKAKGDSFCFTKLTNQSYIKVNPRTIVVLTANKATREHS